MTALIVENPDFAEGLKVGHSYYQSEYTDAPVTDAEIIDIIAEVSSPHKRARDAAFAYVLEATPSTDAYYAGFVTGCLKNLSREPQLQHVHITCQHNHVEILTAEFTQQLMGQDTIEVHDWGWSSKSRTGYIVLRWQGKVDPAFEEQLLADKRIDKYTIFVYQP